MKYTLDTELEYALMESNEVYITTLKDIGFTYEMLEGMTMDRR